MESIQLKDVLAIINRVDSKGQSVPFDLEYTTKEGELIQLKQLRRNRATNKQGHLATDKPIKSKDQLVQKQSINTVVTVVLPDESLMSIATRRITKINKITVTY